MTWFCITEERTSKTSRIMRALHHGWGEPGEVILGPPPDDGRPFVVWGQRFLSEDLIPSALKSGRRFWHVDNGFHLPARGGPIGYYRITYCGLSPIYLDYPRYDRHLGVNMLPWRSSGEKVLLALPGPFFGRVLGMDMRVWGAYVQRMLRRYTSRPISIRPKSSGRPLDRDLQHSWVVVTHSSNVSVDAIIRGVPVVCEPTCPAAPVALTDLSRVDHPVMPDRERWWASLMTQQFTLEEMATGQAYECLMRVRDQHESTRQEIAA